MRTLKENRGRLHIKSSIVARLSVVLSINWFKGIFLLKSGMSSMPVPRYSKGPWTLKGGNLIKNNLLINICFSLTLKLNDKCNGKYKAINNNTPIVMVFSPKDRESPFNASIATLYVLPPTLNFESRYAHVRHDHANTIGLKVR